MFGVLRGFPAERGSGKATGFGARGEASPLYRYIDKYLCFSYIIFRLLIKGNK